MRYKHASTLMRCEADSGKLQPPPACLYWYISCIHVFPHFRAQCAALSMARTACSASRHTSLPTYLPRLPQNAGTFLVCVGRFNKLPRHLDYTRTHNALPAVNHDWILSGNQDRCLLLIVISSPSPIFSHTPPCVSNRDDLWPPLLWPHSYPAINADSLRREAEALTELFYWDWHGHFWKTDTFRQIATRKQMMYVYRYCVLKQELVADNVNRNTSCRHQSWNVNALSLPV